MITIDGSQGEGGGQILRTSLALSLVTGQPVRIERVRAKRQKPGLLKQHLTAVEAAKTVGCAEVEGAALSSQTLEFRPGPVTPGNCRFAVGTAGSATLLLQTILPALLTASGQSTLTLEVGTHNPMAPPFDFLARCFMPLIHRMPSIGGAPAARESDWSASARVDRLASRSPGFDSLAPFICDHAAMFGRLNRLRSSDPEKRAGNQAGNSREQDTLSGCIRGCNAHDEACRGNDAVVGAKHGGSEPSDSISSM